MERFPDPMRVLPVALSSAPAASGADTVDERIAAVARLQYGVISAAQLAACGLAGSAVHWRVDKGRLHRLHRGVYAVGHPALPREGRWLAAVLAAGARAALSHLDAAACWNICPSRFARQRAVSIVKQGRHRKVLQDVRVHESITLAASDVVVRHGIPVTTVARTLLDLGDMLDPFQVAHFMHEAAFRQRLDVVAVDDVLCRSGGRRRAARVLAEARKQFVAGGAGCWSELEDEFLAGVLGAGVAAPVGNGLVHVPGGAVRVDFHWPRDRLCVEIDGSGHERKRTRRADHARDARLRAAGYQVMRIRADEIPQGVQRVIDRLEGAGRHAPA